MNNIVYKTFVTLKPRLITFIAPEKLTRVRVFDSVGRSVKLTPESVRLLLQCYSLINQLCRFTSYCFDTFLQLL